MKLIEVGECQHFFGNRINRLIMHEKDVVSVVEREPTKQMVVDCCSGSFHGGRRSLQKLFLASKADVTGRRFMKGLLFQPRKDRALSFKEIPHGWSFQGEIAARRPGDMMNRP